MLTIPKEMVPLQMARGVLLVLSLSRSRERVGVGARLGAVFGAIANILDSVRAVGGLAARSPCGRLPRRLECAAQSIGEPTVAGDQGADLGDGRLAAASRGGLAPDGAPGAPMGRLAAGARLGIPRTDLLHRALGRLPARRTLRRLSDRPRDRATACGAGRLAAARGTASRDRSPRGGRLAGGNLGDQATRRRGLGPVARVADGGDDCGVHLVGPHRRPPGFTLDLWVAAVAVRCGVPGGFYEDSSRSPLAADR